MESYDINNDGVIDKQEAQSIPELDSEQEFQQADTNNDGVIDMEELKKSLQAGIKKHFQFGDDTAPIETTQEATQTTAMKPVVDPDYGKNFLKRLDELGVQNGEVDPELVADTYYQDENYNPKTGKEHIIDYGEDRSAYDIGHDDSLRAKIDDALNSGTPEDFAEILNAISYFPKYKDTEKHSEGVMKNEAWDAAYNQYNATSKFDHSALGKVADTGELWQEKIYNELYTKLSTLDMDQLKEIDKATDGKINWKRVANKVAEEKVPLAKRRRKDGNAARNASKAERREASKDWLIEFKEYGKQVDKAAAKINELSPRIDKEEVEQIAYEEFVENAKADTKAEEAKAEEAKAEEAKAEDKPIQTTEKTYHDDRKAVIKAAWSHIRKHGKSLPKELKDKLQGLGGKFTPLKFDVPNDNNEENNNAPINMTEDAHLENTYSGATKANQSNGSINLNFSNSNAVVRSSDNPKHKFGVSSTATKGGGVSLPKAADVKMNFSNGLIGDFIGDFKVKKPNKIDIEPVSRAKNKKTAFPDLSPDVEYPTENSHLVKGNKAFRPIIKQGLYQDADDKVDNDIYDKLLEKIIDDYKSWPKHGDVYTYKLESLGVQIYYDGCSQPKIRTQSNSSFGSASTMNLSTFLTKPGGRQTMQDVYNILDE